MPAQKRQMKLGVSMIGLGYHVASWRHPDVPADGSPNIKHSVEVAQTAERGKLDMVFLADAVGIREYDEPPGALCRFSNSSRFEPITLLAALSMATERIGLVATLSTTNGTPVEDDFTGTRIDVHGTEGYVQHEGDRLRHVGIDGRGQFIVQLRRVGEPGFLGRLDRLFLRAHRQRFDLPVEHQDRLHRLRHRELPGESRVRIRPAVEHGPVDW